MRKKIALGVALGSWISAYAYDPESGFRGRVSWTGDCRSVEEDVYDRFYIFATELNTLSGPAMFSYRMRSDGTFWITRRVPYQKYVLRLVDTGGKRKKTLAARAIEYGYTPEMITFEVDCKAYEGSGIRI